MVKQSHRQTVPAHVDVEIPAVPTTTSVPKDLLKTLIWVGGLIVLGLSGWGAYLVAADHSKAAAKEHDEQFQKVEKAKEEKSAIEQKMKDHEREDIQAITKLSEQTNLSILKLTDAINTQSGNAEIARQWVRSSNLAVQASVSDLIARTCRKDNANSKDPRVCDKEVKEANDAADAVKKQNEKANEATTTYQRVQIAPPITAVPVPSTK